MERPSTQNWVEDLYWKQLDINYPGMPRAMVHHGFYYAYRDTTIRPGILDAVIRAKDLYGDINVMATGNSMGKAMASFCRLDLVLFFSWTTEPDMLYTGANSKMSEVCLFSQLYWTEWSQKWYPIQIHVPSILISMTSGDFCELNFILESDYTNVHVAYDMIIGCMNFRLYPFSKY
ncbi:uncharacterized protein LOC104415044 isoform X2 [Eucalyptus grandis]|uniref:uncharacterized protein LOC104415044 isoform X2 n=1 Tax=Eucalyptus grandis TaxID=71139 RepID=UPI00192E81EF|nr:uncharacterized protein LOC104415044 isoform X2 [Eucalyptus grandis]